MVAIFIEGYSIHSTRMIGILSVQQDFVVVTCAGGPLRQLF